MSDLEPLAPLDRLDVIVVEPEEPFVDAAEAEEVVTRAFHLLRSGQEAVAEAQEEIETGRQLLLQAERREAWKILGFESWDALMLDGISKHLRHVLDPLVRQRLAVQMRVRNQATLRQIADAFDVSHPTILRDLREARRIGELVEDDEPRATRIPVQKKASRVSPRPDLAKTFLNHTVELVRRARALQRLREDDRYARRLGDLLRTRGDLLSAQHAIEEVLSDFDANLTKEDQ